MRPEVLSQGQRKVFMGGKNPPASGLKKRFPAPLPFLAPDTDETLK
jgi:hypothetical protein